jgi:hypothetical protein
VASAYRVWAGLMAVAVVVQIGLAGVGAFHAANKVEDKPAESISKDSFDSWFTPHGILGTVLILAALILLIIALVGVRPRWKVSALILGLFVLQAILAGIGDAAPWLGWLHPINALVILAVLGRVAFEEWRGRTAAAPAAV